MPHKARVKRWLSPQRVPLPRLYKYVTVAAVGLLCVASSAHASTVHSAASLAIFANPLEGFTDSFQTFMTGSVAKTGSLAAIVCCGIAYATGEPHAKKLAVGTAIGVALANGAANALTWFSTGS